MKNESAYPIPGQSTGITMRDWFAGMALNGMIAGSKGLSITTEQFAEQSYVLADAMLKHREITDKQE